MAGDGDTRLMDEIILVISRTSQAQGSSWVRRHIALSVYQMLSAWDSDVRIRTAVRALPKVEDAWFHNALKYPFVAHWMSAASHLRYTSEIGQSVVEVLLRMACAYQWRPHITGEAWRWLKRRPQLPPVCRARSLCCNDLGAISKVESFNDVEILRDYLIVVWSEWDWLAPWVCSYMCAVIRKRFGGERKKGHRDELRDRLLHIQKQLDLGMDHLRNQGSEMSADYLQPTKEAYRALLETLSEVESLRISRESTPDHERTSPYRQPTSPYYQPASPYYQPASPYYRSASPYHQPASPYYQPTSPYDQPTSPYDQPPSPYHERVPRYRRRTSRSPERIVRSRRSTSHSPKRIVRSHRSTSRSPERIVRSLESTGED